MITFEGLRKVQQAERKGGLSGLPPNFFFDVGEYLEDVEGLEKKNAENVIEDILERRESKILELAYSSSQGANVSKENLSAMEDELFSKISKELAGYRAKVLNKDNHKKVKALVRFLQDFPKFAGVDGEYGPFKAGSIEGIPPENAEILIRKKVVEYESTTKS